MIRSTSFLVNLNLILVTSSLLTISPIRGSSDSPCPTIAIKCLTGEKCVGHKEKLLVEVRGGRSGYKPTYTWCLSAGTITSGQSSDTIEIDTSTVTDKWITVVVMIGGLDRACTNVVTYRIVFEETTT